MTQDFEAFAREFRQRTTARLLQFEKALAQAQDELEKSATTAAQQDRPARSAQQPQTEPTSATRTGRSRQAVPSQHKAPARRGGPGQVKSVLRRD